MSRELGRQISLFVSYAQRGLRCSWVCLCCLLEVGFVCVALLKVGLVCVACLKLGLSVSLA
jgi:hypothetical protein